MYEGAVTTIRSPIGETSEFPITAGLHQGSALSPYLFALVMDELTRNLQENIPWCMMFADDIILVDETARGVNTKLEIWREALESKGSIISSDGEIADDVTHRIQVGRLKWRSATDVLCDKRAPTKLKEKFYGTAIRPAMLYGTKCWPIKKQQVNKMGVAEMRMLRWMCGKTRRDKIRNETVREMVGVAPIEEKLRENRLRVEVGLISSFSPKSGLGAYNQGTNRGYFRDTWRPVSSAKSGGRHDTGSEVPGGRYDTSSEMSDGGQSPLSLGPVKSELTGGKLILLDKPLALAFKSHSSLGLERGDLAPLEAEFVEEACFGGGKVCGGRLAPPGGEDRGERLAPPGGEDRGERLAPLRS
ncbi:hypothetical protein RHMOL_Rhmol01G0213400 [Rhododendron molle]|uniref:Uncharacterized protein n=1 Tax=Rhododendron molle TaxID=49168 RepID=A0ACC0Q5S3_RHOML|nr:hypothetical protein RHMOL_Rhmol01G0213400 [Rhododendron molle]